METDEAFSEAVANEVVRQQGRLSLKEELAGMRGELFEEEDQASEQSRFQWWKVAAAVVVLLLPISFWLLISSGPNTEELMTEYFAPYPGTPIVRDSGSAFNEVWQNGMQLYKQQSYEKAIPLLDSAHRLSPSLATLSQFYRAQCYLSLDPPNLENAQKLLEPMVEEKGPYFNQARWYLALVYLGQGKEKQAASLFQKISEAPDAYNKGEAAKILDQLSE